MKLFKRRLNLFALIIALFFLGGLSLALIEKTRAITWPNFHNGNTLIKKGKLRVEGTGTETMRLSVGPSATELMIDAPGAPYICVGMAGANEIGSTEGYVELGDAADFLRFSVQLPDTWLDLGSAGNLSFEFDLLEIAAADITIDIAIYEYANTTAIITDTITIVNGTARAWTAMDSGGIGADADIGPGDVLFFEVTSHTNDDDFRGYGVRMNFNPGIEKTS